MSNAADLGSASTGGTFPFGGVGNTYSQLNTNTFQGSAFQNFAGYGASISASVAQSTLSLPQGVFQSFSGYASSFAGVVESGTAVINSLLTDNQPPLTWTKNQQIYYKMVGFNTNTQTFETWIIAEEIVPRPETFDPTGNFPNIDYNVFFTPPSGNKLVNIKIVGRWIQ